MTEFIRRVEKLIFEQKKSEKEREENARELLKKFESIHSVIITALNDLHNESTLSNNLSDIVRLSPNVLNYTISIGDYTFDISKETIMSEIEKKPNFTVRDIVDAQIIAGLQTSFCPPF
jgi:hypothetical protein